MQATMYTIEYRTITTALTTMNVTFHQIAFKSPKDITPRNLNKYHIVCDIVVPNPFQKFQYLAIRVGSYDRRSLKLCQLTQEFAVNVSNVPYTSYEQEMTIQTEYLYKQLLNVLKHCDVQFEHLFINPRCPSLFTLFLYEDFFNVAKSKMYLVHYLFRYVSYHLGHELIVVHDQFRNRLSHSEMF